MRPPRICCLRAVRGAALGLWCLTACSDPATTQAGDQTLTTPVSTPTPALPAAAAPAAADKKTCTGEPTACSALTAQPGCDQQLGCVWAAASCADRGCQDTTDEAACKGQGCRWDPSCLGTSVPCTALTNEGTCSRHDRCQWVQIGDGAQCVGADLPCYAYDGDPAACAQHQGCAPGTSCKNTPGVGAGCSAFASQAACAASSRCQWVEAGCFGEVVACGAATSEAACGRQAGCGWAAAPSAP